MIPILLLVLSALNGLALAHHTADHIYEVARLALKEGNEGFILEQSSIFFFKDEGSLYTFGFEGEKGTRYKIIVVTDKEVLTDVDIAVMDGDGKMVFSEIDPATTSLSFAFVSKGGTVKVGLIAAEMPEGSGYAAVLIMREEAVAGLNVVCPSPLASGIGNDLRLLGNPLKTAFFQGCA